MASTSCNITAVQFNLIMRFKHLSRFFSSLPLWPFHNSSTISCQLWIKWSYEGENFLFPHSYLLLLIYCKCSFSCCLESMSCPISLHIQLVSHELQLPNFVSFVLIIPYFSLSIGILFYQKDTTTIILPVDSLLLGWTLHLFRMLPLSFFLFKEESSIPSFVAHRKRCIMCIHYLINFVSCDFLFTRFVAVLVWCLFCFHSLKCLKSLIYLFGGRQCLKRWQPWRILELGSCLLYQIKACGVQIGVSSETQG